MTVSLPVTLPAPPQHSQAKASPKGLATAPAKGLDKHAGAADTAGSAEASGVADMFAALVAALTQQMQPQATATNGETGEVAVDTATATAVPVEGATDVVTIPVPAAAPTVVAPADGIDVPVDTVPVDAVPVDAVPVDAVPIATVPLDGDTAAPEVSVDAPVEDSDETHRATPATPAVPGEKFDDEGTKLTGQDRRATPATPAVPAHRAAPEAPVDTAPAIPTTVPIETIVAPAAAAAAVPVTDTDDAATPAVGATPATPATPASAATAHAEAATPARPAAPADPHVQVARIVRPLRLGEDGSYDISLDLAPKELGRVRIDVELRGATISLTLHAESAATRDLLQTSLGRLRAELEAAGLHAGHLDVGGRGTDGRGAPGQGDSSNATHSAEHGANGADDAPVTTQIPVATDTADGSVDIRA